MTEHDDDQLDAAHRLAAILDRAMDRARGLGLGNGAISTALIGAGVRAARQDMGPEALAGWLRDIAEGVEREGEAHDTAGHA